MQTRFQEIINESKKVYPFKIGIAGELPEGCEDRLKTSLAKFDVKSMSKGKKTPIQERPLDFPQLQNEQVTYWEVEFAYPTTAQVLGEYVKHCCGIAGTHIVVRNPNEPEELYQEKKEDDVYETILTQEDMGGDSAQKDVAGNRVMDLLKELEKARKEREHDAASAAPEAK